MIDGVEINEIIEKNEKLVREVAYRLGKESDDDAIQQGRIGLWEAAKVWDGKRPFEPLARRCIRNNIIDYSRYKAPDEDELTEDVAAEEPVDEESKEELLSRIKNTFTRRSAEWKVLSSLLSGKTKKCIAKRLGVSERTVDRIAKKAVETLKRKKQGLL